MMLIRGGRIYYKGALQEKNILIDGKKIVDILDDTPEADTVIDAAGLLVFPGAVDAHVHCREPGATEKEDFASASRAAAAGGITTMLDMPNTTPPTTTVALLEAKRKLVAKSIVNYGLYMGADGTNAEELRKAANIAGVKLYLGKSTGDMAVTGDDALGQAFGCGKLVVVHAEDDACMEENAKKYGDAAVDIHGKVRSRECAVIAVKKAIALAEGKVHITHVSTKEEVALIAAAKKTGKKITADCTPHHLFLSEEDLGRLGNYGKMNPPLRTKEDNEALWEGLRTGIIDMVATDHAPHLRSEKETAYRDAPSGVPGLETMLPLLLDAACRGTLPLELVPAITAEKPAEVLGIRGKGKIEKGYDADLVIIDSTRELRVENGLLQTKCNWSPFDGFTLRGWPVITIVNGNVVYDNGELGEIPGEEVRFT